MQISITLSGPAKKVCDDLASKATNSPETEIRDALANFFAEECDEDDHVEISVSITAKY